MDSAQRWPDHPDYDPTTLFLPDKEFKKLTLNMQNYWTIKSKHFDSIILWRKGDWYVTFFQDSVILNKLCDKVQRTPNSECGFYKKWIEEFVDLFVSAGYKVVWVE